MHKLIEEHRQAESVIRRFESLGYIAGWGGGSDRKGHGYWIWRKGGKTLRRSRLIRGLFNQGNMNPYFQMHHEAMAILRRLESIGAIVDNGVAEEVGR